MKNEIILVHSGHHFIDYINDCIGIVSKYNFNIHLIIESKLFDSITNKTIHLVDLESVIDDRYTNFKLDKYDNAFRHNFWTKTSSRFILLDNYITKYNLESCFHIENDIAIFSNFDRIEDTLLSSLYDTAIVMDTQHRCIPSVVWYRNSEATTRMANFIKNNNNKDDMYNLGRYFNKHRDRVTNFPIVPFDFQPGDINYGNLFNEFHSVFDGAAIGQFLYGTHDKPSLRGFINPTTIFNVSKLDIQMIDKKPFIKTLDGIIPINNLHMHCKNLKQLL